MIIGITGQVGVGKSTAARVIQLEMNADVIDLDRVGHQLLARQSVHARCESIAGISLETLMDKNNRQRFGEIVFADKKKLKQLNNLMHPLILAEVKRRLDQLDSPCIIIVGALIHEIGLRLYCNHLLTITADRNKIKQHIGQKYDKIALYQKAEEDYIELADSYIRNSFDTSFKSDVKKVIKQIVQQAS